jgi:DnaJ homolog subfamily C member 13
VLQMRGRASNMSIQLLDDVCENPELIWTREMQGEIRTALTKLFSKVVIESTSGRKGPNGEEIAPDQDFSRHIETAFDYAVPYRQLQNEIYIGGVYIRLYLKQPTFRLTNPIFFMEKLIEFWEGAFDTQVPLNDKVSLHVHEDDQENCKALVLGKEDFLSLLTSCVVCVIKGESSVVDHLLSWGFTHKLIELLKRALDKGRVGVPVTSVVRLLFELCSRSAAVDSMVDSPHDPMLQLCRSLNISSDVSEVLMPKEAALVVELLKRIFQCMAAQCLPDFVDMAMRAKLPLFLLDNVIGASNEKLSNVRNYAAMKVHAVDVIKAMLLVESSHVGILQAMLDAHHSWKEFKHQSHDLFISVGHHATLYDFENFNVTIIIIIIVKFLSTYCLFASSGS